MKRTLVLLLFSFALTAPARAQQPVTVTYVENASVDPDGGPLTHEWSVEGPEGGAMIAPDGRRAHFTYSLEGQYLVRVVVRDQYSEVVGTFATEVVINLPPTPPVIEGPPTVILPPDEIVRVWGPHVMVAAEVADTVQGVRFFVGDLQLGPEDTTPPFQTLWDSTKAPDELYCLWAETIDERMEVVDRSFCNIVEVVNEDQRFGPAPYLLAKNSPAIDMVPCLAGMPLDMRGAPRGRMLGPVPEGSEGPCDVGAIEFQPEDYSLAVVRF